MLEVPSMRNNGSTCIFALIQPDKEKTDEFLVTERIFLRLINGAIRKYRQ
jgi:hypothetical protein